MRLLLAVFLHLPSLYSTAQTLPLEAVSEQGIASLRHTVAPKENWYSIGRIYNLPPRTIADHNRLTIDKGLEIGQTLSIPLLPANFTQTPPKAAAGEALVPIHHTVKEKEGLYRIGQDHNRLSVDRLKALNGLTGDAISVGSRLVIGHLRVRKDQSPLASMEARPAPPETVDAKPTPATPKEKEAESRTSSNVQTKRTDDATPPRPSVVEVEKPKQVVAERPKTPDMPDARRDISVTPPASSSSASPGGFFNALFNEQMKGAQSQTATGLAAAFKSSIGREERKYYALMGGVTPNTVIRITNPANGKQLYAKVLNELPQMRENDGLLLRLGSPAMEELGLGDGRHEVRVSWSK
jgi:LysM repeat protein